MKKYGLFYQKSKALKDNHRSCHTCFIILTAFLMTAPGLFSETNHRYTGTLNSSENQASILEIIEMNGMVSHGGTWQLSLRDTESGERFWLRQGQERRGIAIAHVDGHKKSAILTGGGSTLELQISDASDAIMWLRSGKVTLTRYNMILLQSHRNLIKLKQSESTGRLLRNNTAQQALEKFILTNPSVDEVANLVTALPEIYDMEAFLGIPFEGVHGRSNQDTAGWGVVPNPDMEALKKAIQSGASIEEIDNILKNNEA